MPIEYKRKVRVTSKNEIAKKEILLFYNNNNLRISLKPKDVIGCWPEPEEEWSLVVLEPDYPIVSHSKSAEILLRGYYDIVSNLGETSDWVWFSSKDIYGYCETKTCQVIRARFECDKSESPKLETEVIEFPLVFIHNPI